MRGLIREIILESLGDAMIIDIIKNPEKSEYYGSRFGQDVEPAGTYVLQSDGVILDGWLEGKATINKPLFVDVTSDTLISYKNDLALEYKAKGKTLTKKLMNKGYDALITRVPSGDFVEIVLFPNCTFMLH